MAKRKKDASRNPIDVWVADGSGYLIRKRGNRYQVDMGTQNGTRRRQGGFKILADAEQWCREEYTRLQNQGTESLNLSETDRLSLVEAKKKLDGVPLMTAVAFYLKHHPTVDVPTVAELVEAYTQAKGRRGKKTVHRRKATVDGLRWRLNRFAGDYGQMSTAEVTRDLIEGWLDVNEWQPQNRQHYLAAVHGMFEYAVSKRYVAENPAAEIRKPIIPATDPEILTPKQIETLLKTAAAEIPEMLPRLTLGFFCGLRQYELDRLTWDSLSLDNALVTINGDVAKVQGHKRHVTIPAAGIAWLTLCKRSTGHVWPFSSKTTLHRKRNALTETSGIKIPQNAPRHAYASYHLACHQNAATTADQMGHVSGVKLLVNRYRNIMDIEGKPITQEQAKQFWNIRPKHAKTEDGAIEFPARAAS